MYIYLDKDGYVYGYGSDPEENSYEVESVPVEVDQNLGAYFYDPKTGKYTADDEKIEWLQGLISAEREADQIQRWFTEYDATVSKLLREQRLGIKSRGASIDELDAEAMKKASRLEELRMIMETPYEKGVKK